MSTPIIQISGLTKTFGEIKALDGLDLTVSSNVIFGFLGPNGAGKSTCLRILLTLVKADSGEIKIFSQELLKNRASILSRIGCIVEKPDFYLYLSARENLKMLARLSRANPTERKIDQILELVGLAGRAHDKVKTYSLGMKQRLGLAQTLVHDPDLILLDEPTTGLDPQGIIDFRKLLLDLKKETNKTIVLSSHILSEIELIADELVIINKGKSVVQGKVSELMNDENLIVQLEISDVLFAKQKISESFPSSEAVIIDQNKLEFTISRQEIPIVHDILRAPGVKIYSLFYKRRLENYFLKLTAS